MVRRCAPCLHFSPFTQELKLVEHRPAFTWKFQRLGGLDQVTLRSAEELRRLSDLDPKLWAALSCPASGLEFDTRTLSLLDTDQDGRIRIPEVLAAVDWLCGSLQDPAAIVEPAAAMPLSLIRDDNDNGRRLKASAHAILESLGKPGADSLSQEDVTKAAASAARNIFNGDGVVPALPDIEPEVRDFILDALEVVGGVMDASGQPGINRDIAAAFIKTLEDREAWKNAVDGAANPLGGDVAEAWDLLQRLKVKIDDYFLRCDLASFAPGALDSLNTPAGTGEKVMATAEHGLLEADVLADLPLSRIEADRSLQLASGLNPAWRDLLTRFFRLITPLLSQPDSLTREDWTAVRQSFAPYADAVAQKPGLASVETAIPPVSPVDKLSDARVREILSSQVITRFNELADRDASAPAASSDIAAVERLVLYYLHLHRLLMNFVSFYDFYALKRKAMFQAGTLYLDGRGCRLCLPVSDVAKHSAIAAFSHLCLVYCECRRTGSKGGDTGGQSTNIVAAMTAGDADLLMDGRNGVYVDSLGNDWDAAIVKIISNPISLRQSLLEPYKRFGRMVTEQIAKFAAAKQDSLSESAAKKINDAQAAATGSAPAASQPFDIGKSVGIFAAIGLALGAIGTAMASIANALFALSWWQFPLVLLGFFLLISGPSFVLAWLKLRKRTLGPLLDASGWAVNSNVPINFTLGKALTATAVLPPNATRNYTDPLHKPSRWPLLILLLVLLLGAGAGWLWFNADKYGLHLPKWPEITAPAASTAPAAPAAPAGVQTPAKGVTPVETEQPKK